MSSFPYGELTPIGGGDPIPLEREILTVGRRESCDICLPFPNISGLHCELSYRMGYWYVRDLNSTNGIKVNGERKAECPLKPEDTLTIAKRDYKITYDLTAEAKQALADSETDDEDLINRSLMEKAGLVRKRRSV